MTILEALARFEAARAMNINRRGCSMYFTYAPRAFFRTTVRRRKGESFADMLIRCAALDAERHASGWQPEPPKKKPAPKLPPDWRIEKAERSAKTLKFPGRES